VIRVPHHTEDKLSQAVASVPAFYSAQAWPLVRGEVKGTVMRLLNRSIVSGLMSRSMDEDQPIG